MSDSSKRFWLEKHIVSDSSGCITRDSRRKEGRSTRLLWKYNSLASHKSAQRLTHVTFKTKKVFLNKVLLLLSHQLQTWRHILLLKRVTPTFLNVLTQCHERYNNSISSHPHLRHCEMRREHTYAQAHFGGTKYRQYWKGKNTRSRSSLCDMVTVHLRIDHLQHLGTEWKN